MATKILKTRVQNKCDTAANWKLATNFKPLKGEIILYTDTKQMKVGDGNTLVNNLPFYPSGDVTAEGNNTFSGTNTFTDTVTFKTSAATIATSQDGKLSVSNGLELDFNKSTIKFRDAARLVHGTIVQADASVHSGSTDVTLTLPKKTGTIVADSTDNTFTGTNTFKNNNFIYSTVTPTYMEVKQLGDGNGNYTFSIDSTKLTKNSLSIQHGDENYLTQYTARNITYKNGTGTTHPEITLNLPYIDTTPPKTTLTIATLEGNNTFTGENRFNDFVDFGEITQGPAALRIEKASNIVIVTQYAQAVSGTCGEGLFVGTFTPMGSNIRNVKILWTTGVIDAKKTSTASYKSSTNAIEYTAVGSSASAEVSGIVTYTADVTAKAWRIKHHSEYGQDYTVNFPNKSGTVALVEDAVEVVPNPGNNDASAALTSLRIGGITYSISSGATVIEITGASSGTFTAAEISKLTNPTTIIKVANGEFIFRLSRIADPLCYYYAIYAGTKGTSTIKNPTFGVKVMTIDLNSGAWTQTTTQYATLNFA